MKQSLMCVISIGIGIFFWIIACKLTGELEAWDSPYYFTIALPVFMLINFILGMIMPKNGWMWGVLSTMAQMIPMILAQELGKFWIVGVITLVFLCIPSVLAAMLGSRLSKRVLL